MATALYTIAAMRRLLTTLATLVLTFALTAPAALAQNSGQGAIGEASDKTVTNAGFILIGFFPLFILLMSLLQNHLEKRKDARKSAAKARGNSAVWKGGW
jgi:preprotein translocase subunit SecG